MSRFVAGCLTFTLLGCIVACAPAPAPQPDEAPAPEETAMTDEEILSATTEEWIEAFNAGDGGAIAAMMSEDGMLLPPNSEPVAGREAIAEFWQSFIDTGVSGTLDHSELIVGEDFAVKIGDYGLFDAEGGQADAGKWMEVWTREGDGWKMHRDLWNSNMPEAGAEEQ